MVKWTRPNGYVGACRSATAGTKAEPPKGEQPKADKPKRKKVAK